MGSLNKVMLIGNLGRDAELRFTKGGTPVASFSMATTEKWTGKDGEKREDTQWHRCQVWGKTAEALHEYLTKGKQVYAEGRLQTRKWTDKNGAERETTEINVDKITLLGGGGGGRSEGGDRPQRSSSRRASRPDDAGAQADSVNDEVAQDDMPTDDEIPF